jgi:hypothetical protein
MLRSHGDIFFLFKSGSHLRIFEEEKNLKLAENEHERVRHAEREGNEKKCFV